MKKIGLAVFTLLFSASVFAQTAETVKIYNPEADAKADVKAAVSRAAAKNKHVFVQVGGNWCSWCIAFHKLVDTTPTLKNFLNENYEVVLVNYSKENKNMPLLNELGNPQRFGFPVFLILDAKGKVLHIQNSAYLESREKSADGKTLVGHDPEEVLNFLKGWTVSATDPKTYSALK